MVYFLPKKLNLGNIYVLAMRVLAKPIVASDFVPTCLVTRPILRAQLDSWRNLVL